MIDYVVGFLFTGDGKSVCLVRKSHPDWQRGKLNGVGGKIECGEQVRSAMAREFFEEAGVATESRDWSLHVRLLGSDFTCFVLAAHLPNPVPVTADGDEPCGWYETGLVPVMPDVIPNLRWLIPLCLDHGPVKHVNVRYARRNGHNNPGPAVTTPTNPLTTGGEK